MNEASVSHRSVWGALVSAGLAAMALALPIAFLAFAAWISYAGCFFKCEPTDRPDYVASGVYAGLAVVLLVDIVLCGVAGHRRWERPWPWLALGPPAALGLTYGVMTILGVW